MPTVDEIYNLASVAAGHTSFPHNGDVLRGQGLLQFVGPGRYALTELGDAYMLALEAVPLSSVQTSALVFNEAARTLNGVYFPKTRWEILQLLWARRGHLVSRERVHALICEGKDREPMIKTVDVHICNIRTLLRGLPLRIDTLLGTGWTLTETITNG